ncbi:CCR4-NOT transcription complex subunit 7/8 [Gracilaria domingensis]|nr:CCR4-NOT transcription complex subunit 7/8 [Gracilaria domingensis]
MARTSKIRQVWASNLEQEILTLSDLSEVYNHIAMDTEFPGVVLRPIGSQATQPDALYCTHRLNVDLLKIIQIGISLSTEDGKQPEECTTWQFNFSFSLSNDMYAQDSIELLSASGIDFAEHERNGIDVLTFGELITSSGLVLNPQVTWICFSGGYDFCYLIKLLTAVPLPEHEAGFFEYLSLFFPRIYDIKYLMLSSDRLHGGLNKVAEMLGCERIGAMHQAGSDSLLTLDVFFKMKEQVFHDAIDDSNCGILYNLGMTVKNSGAHGTAGSSPAYTTPRKTIPGTDGSNGNGEGTALSSPS